VGPERIILFSIGAVENGEGMNKGGEHVGEKVGDWGNRLGKGND
jgi:hypothetical protein